MPRAIAQSVAPARVPLCAPDRPVKILARSIYRELRSNGYQPQEIVALSSELLGLLTSEMKGGR